MSRLTEAFEQLSERVGRLPLLDLVAFLTVYTLFRISHFPLDMGLSVAAAVGVCFTHVRRSRWFWLTIVALWLPRMVFQFHLYEDHAFFVIYWCAAMGMVMWGRHQEFVMRRSARLMIGICFALGFIWKIVSPEFFDGSLFHFKLLYDYRFAEMVTEPVGGLTAAMSESNIQAYHALRETDASSVPLQYSPQVTWLAIVMTIWTIFIEGLIAGCFLISPSRLTDKVRDAVLILFLLSTYFVVPVMGFCCAFVTLGIAQTRSDRARLAYLLTALVTFFWFTLRG